MNKERILEIGKKLTGQTVVHGFHAQAAEIKNLISSVAGKNNPFYEAVDKVKILAHFSTDQLNSILVTFLRSVENDLISNVSYKRKIKIEVVNDYLEQAEELLDKNEYHSAIAAFLIGASLEEFLRNWVAEQYLELENQKPSISTYAAVLRKNELLDKQDLKDITAWSGIRNDAAHGKWNLVDDKSKINVMLSGVSIFIKKYST